MRHFNTHLGWLIVVLCIGCSESQSTQEQTDGERQLVDAAVELLGDSLLLDALPPDAMPDLAIDARISNPDLGQDADVPLPDRDNDGVPDVLDDFPDDPNYTTDSDGDGAPNELDDDDDNDGLTDVQELAYGDDCKISDPTRSHTDDDGIDDPQDRYPFDPFPEFMLRKSPSGAIEGFLSNRDGTFGEGVFVAFPFEHNGRMLGYEAFSIADFDGNGIMDFVAHSEPLVDGEPTRNFYFFYREAKADEFIRQFIGTTDTLIIGAVSDINGDHAFDIVTTNLRQAGEIASGTIDTFLNNVNVAADCVYSLSADDECFFTRVPPLDITSTVNRQWKARSAFQTVNVNPQTDDHLDLTLFTYPTGGNTPTRVYTLFGRGDGTFEAPQLRFTHNRNREQSPGNSIIFGDFNGDDVGDVIVGFDDDGLSGAAWTYFGYGDGTFNPMPVEALDINPTNALEMGSGNRESLGREASGRTFDFDFDGRQDLIIGVRHFDYDAPGQTRLYRGLGDGTFDPNYLQIGGEVRNPGGFAIPQPLCPEFNGFRQ